MCCIYMNEMKHHQLGKMAFTDPPQRKIIQIDKFY